MKELIKIAVQQRKVVLFIALMAVFLGIYNYYEMPKQENPYVEAGAAIITTVYPGASPEDVEQLVTKKIEDAVSELSEYKKVSSESGKNVSVVIVIYNDEANIEQANRELREKIDAVKGKLPQGCREPEINTDLAEAAGMLVSLAGDDFTYEQLTFYAEEIKKVIGEIDGIYKTEVVGNVDRQVTVEVDMDKLNQFNITLSEIERLLYLQNLEIPSGALESHYGKIAVKTRAPYQSIDDLSNTIVEISSETGAVVRLKDIASVELELKDDVGRCKQGEKNAVIVAGYFEEEKNIIPIGKQVREALASIRQNLPQGLVLTEVTFQPDDVKNKIGNFVAHLIIGMILVVIVIFIGMGPRNAVVVSLAIPFTVGMTFILMNATNVKLQSVSLAGLIVALGMIVDNAVVISDAVKVEYEHGASKEDAAIKATGSVVMPVFTSTLTTMAAFVPLLFIPGVVGRFISSLPTVVIYALTASFISAAFVTPGMLSMLIEKKGKKRINEGKIKKSIMFLLQWGLSRRKAVAAVVIFLLILTIGFVMPLLNVAFFPKADKNVFYLDTFVEKADLKYTEKVAARINQLISREPEILSVTTGIGTSMPKFYLTMPFLPNREDYTRAIVTFDLTKSDRFMTNHALAVYLQEMLDAQIVGAFSTVKMLEMTDPENAPVEVILSGNDLNRLKEVSRQLEDSLKNIPGTINVHSNAADIIYEYIVRIDPDKASMMGILNSDIQKEVQIALSGSKNTVLRKAGQEFDIEVKSNVTSVNELENLSVKSGITGEKVLLKQVAALTLEPQLDSVKRYNRERSVFVTCDVRPGYSPVDILNYLEQEIVKDMDLNGVQLIFEGEREKIREYFSNVGVLGIFIILLVYSILFIEFKSFTEPLIILFTVPLSLIGSMLGLWIFGKPLSFMALLGVVSLMGIVVNNGILLIDYIKNAKKQGYSSEDACIKAVSLRFRPIMLSALTTVMGLAPLAFSKSELFSPMAIALMGGLMVSTFLTMLVIPVIYVALDRKVG